MEVKLARADLELLRDFLAAMDAANSTCFLVGAGARVLSFDHRWSLRGARTTLDWDFAVHAESWEHWAELTSRLLAGNPPKFTRGRAAHRFVHRSGSVLDLVPYGGIEAPTGEIKWPDRTRMAVHGFRASEGLREAVEVGAGLVVPIAAITSLALLKLHAYRDRRARGERKDIRDFDWFLRHYESAGNEERVFVELADVVRDGRIEVRDAGATLLGLDIARSHASDAIDPARPLLVEARDPWSRLIADLLVGSRGADDESHEGRVRDASARFGAFELGLSIGAEGRGL